MRRCSPRIVNLVAVVLLLLLMASLSALGEVFWLRFCIWMGGVVGA
jgi:hypothetical protein